MQEDDDAFISTTSEATNLATPNSFQSLPKEPSLFGAIELDDIDNAIAL